MICAKLPTKIRKDPIFVDFESNGLRTKTYCLKVGKKTNFDMAFGSKSLPGV